MEETADDAEEQMSLFAVISAVATDPFEHAGHGDEDGGEEVEDGADDLFELALAPPAAARGRGPGRRRRSADAS